MVFRGKMRWKTAHRHTPMTGKMLAHYQVTDKLGAGGMGEVWRARDTRLHRDVALKFLPAVFANDPERLARFEREAQLLAQLNHSNIGAIHGLEESDGVRFLVLEYVPGETLRGPLPLAEIPPIVNQLIDALEEAHEKGITHRDLKPANIKITPDGKVKVLDFGLAKALAGDAMDQVASNSPTLAASALTRGGMLLGTAAYMSPEQARGRPVDKRSDIFAFGSVLYEILTGKQAFGGETISDSLAAILKNEPDRALLPALTPAALRRLLDRCLEKDPKRRLRDIGEARMLLEVSSGAAPEAGPGGPARARGPAPLLVVAAGAVAASLAAATLAVIHFRETPPETPVSRFEIPAPEKTSFNASPVISPDGRRVVFNAQGQDGRALLWVRPLESVEARPLAGTDGGFHPFWSPDSRFIAFSGGGKLKKIEASGGPPQTLCDVSLFAIGGSWNRDGTILFGSNSGGVQRVPAAGGAPAALTIPDLSRQESGHAHPHFLPDGRHFLYLAVSNQAEHSAIYLSSLDSPKERKRLVGASLSAVYAPPQKEGPGHLLYLREGTLMAQPFDARRLELAGDAFPVAEQVSSLRSLAFFSASTNGALAYRTGGGASYHLGWFDRAGKHLGIAGPAGDYQDLALSPDDSRVVASRLDPQSGNRDLWLIELDRNSASRFTFHVAMDQWPVWSPDGARIAFSSPREGPEGLYQKVASGAGSDELLLKPGARALANDWSRDGRHIVFSSIGPKTGSDLWVLRLEADRAQRAPPVPYLQTEFEESQGQFSPDGKFIAYTSNESGRYEVYVQPFPASGAKWMVSAGGASQPRWRRDSKEIFYLGFDFRLMAAEVKTTPQFAASVPKPLFQTRALRGGSAIYYRYAPSADGKRFLVISLLEEAASAPITLMLNWAAGVKR